MESVQYHIITTQRWLLLGVGGATFLLYIWKNCPYSLIMYRIHHNTKVAIVGVGGATLIVYIWKNCQIPTLKMYRIHYNTKVANCGSGRDHYSSLHFIELPNILWEGCCFSFDLCNTWVGRSGIGHWSFQNRCEVLPNILLQGESLLFLALRITQSMKVVGVATYLLYTWMNCQI